MTMEQSPHLSEEALNDLLIGINSPASDAHVAMCPACRSRVADFQTTMQGFNQASLAWSQDRPSLPLRPNREPVSTILAAPSLSWALAAMALVTVGLPLWNYTHRPAEHASAAPAAPLADTESQIAQDNDLLRSVNLALSTGEESPISDYHLLDSQEPRTRPRPELRNQ